MTQVATKLPKRELNLYQVLTRCFLCPHMAYQYVLNGVPVFRCTAAKWHCHHKGQKAKLKLLGLLEKEE